MRGSTPLDVAAASVMDNNELALALEEPDLDKVGGHSDLFTHLLNGVLVLEEFNRACDVLRNTHSSYVLFQDKVD